MWLGERKKTKISEPYVGKVSLNGSKCAVADFSEHRNIVVYAPGGYFWRPQRGDEVLVIKDGIVGTEIKDNTLKPGEVCIRSAGGAEIRLCNDGTVHIKGKIVEEE